MATKAANKPAPSKPAGKREKQAAVYRYVGGERCAHSMKPGARGFLVTAPGETIPHRLFVLLSDESQARFEPLPERPKA